MDELWNLYNRMIRFEPDADGGSGGTSGDAEAGGGDEGTPESGGSERDPTGGESPGEGGSGAGDGDDGGDDDSLTLPRDAFNRRIERAGRSAVSDFLSEVGFESPEAFSDFVEAGKKAIDSQKTAEQLREEQLEQEAEARRAAEEERDQALERARTSELRSAAVSRMSGRFANPDKAFNLLETAEIEKDDSGSWVGLDEAIDQLAQQEPWTLLESQDDGGDGKGDRKPPKIGATNRDDEGEPGSTESDEARRSRYFGKNAGGSGFFDEGRVVEVGG